MGTIPGSPLGKAARYPDRYDPALLYPVDRAPQRAELGIGATLPFDGRDCWTAWEATWLDVHGRPQVAIVTFDIPCASPRIVESKSVKLWLTSLNHAVFATAEAYCSTLQRDLAAATGAEPDVRVHLPADWTSALRRATPEGTPIDDVLPASLPEAPDASLLVAHDEHVAETLRFGGFRSVCPVTGQPDFADVILAYAGPRLHRASLLAYLLGFRRHPGFHEHCVERIFADVQRACAPSALRVEARFTRRGGVDINPVRHRGAAAVSAPTHRQ
jgi:7-cyano-7-deazaguanine reductase